VKTSLKKAKKLAALQMISFSGLHIAPCYVEKEEKVEAPSREMITKVYMETFLPLCISPVSSSCM